MTNHGKAYISVLAWR